jgi:type I restriction enzyme S subunit
MGLSKVKIGSFVESIDIRCKQSNNAEVYGIDINKRFISTRAKMDGIDTAKYRIVPRECFAANFMHIGRDEKIPVAFNNTDDEIIVSPAYFIFKADTSVILNEYFYMLMNSNEFDRYAWFCTDSSIRGNLDWERFCEIEIDLPPLPVQQKYVNVYNAMVKNQKAYESGLDDLKLTCDAYIDELRRKLPHKAIGEYVELSNAKNEDLQYGIDALKGVSINKEFIATKADMAGVSLKPYLLVEPDAFAYVTITSRNGEKISLAHNNSDDTYIVSSSYIVFRVKRKDKLIPSYLNIFFKRSEFDRYARFNSWGSAREAFAWEDMCEVKIPIPDIKVQQSIVNIYNAYITRRDINERLKAQIKDICPILIKGSLEEAKNA